MDHPSSMYDCRTMNFTKLMRSTTRDVHSISDALVNAKLGLSSSDKRVWREGLAVFYEVFRFLEKECLQKLSSLDTRLAHLRIPGMERTERFEEDLEHYYGPDWKVEVGPPSPELSAYIEHMDNLRSHEPVVLAAFIYHMYMGLFSGGQILKKKRQLSQKVPSWLGGRFFHPEPVVGETGLRAVSFDRPISDMKRAMRQGMEALAEELDENTKKRVLEEGVQVFKLNNSVVRTIRSSDEVFRHRMLTWIPIFVIFAGVSTYLLLWLLERT